MATYMGAYVGPSSPYPTIVSFPGFHAEADVMALKNAVKGVGTDEETIITILANRSSSQRQEITQQYKLITGSDLLKDLKGDLSGNLEETVLALMQPPALYDAKLLHRAMKGAGTDEECLIEILSSRTNEEIRGINEVYSEQFRRRLDEDITGDTSGPLRKLLVSLSTGQRSEKPDVDQSKARKEAQELYSAGEKKWGTDESVFLKVLASRSHAQLRATFSAYEEIAQRTILSSIDREMSGHTKKAYNSVVRCVLNPADFFADELYASMKGLGTDDKKLIRIIVSRAEIDLGNIKMAFLAKYNKALHIMVDSDTSGDYRDMLLAIIKP